LGGRRGSVRNVGDEALNSLEKAKLAPNSNMPSLEASSLS